MLRMLDHRQRNAGFTLLELIFVIVVLTILAKVAMMRLISPATLTLHSQAQAMSETVRKAQSLAMLRGQRMQVSVATAGANGSIAIACSTGVTPCGTDTSFSASQDAVVGSANAVYFNSLGQPVNSSGTPSTSDAAFTLSYTAAGTTTTFTVTVAALTGRVSLSP
jgi:prepilin-type N-terminal cleavage/methylation domain-containing protein